MDTTKDTIIPQEEKKRRLTIKQRQWIDNYLKYRNATKAALIVYFPEFNLEKDIKDYSEQETKDYHSARSMGNENLTKLDYQEFMEIAGVTDELLQRKLIEGLDANKVVSAKITSKEANSQTDDFIDVPDYQTRHKYLETSLKLKKRLIERVDHTTLGKELPTPIYGGKAE